MACSKYTLTNTGSTTTTFNYQRCDDAMWEYQVELLPGQTKNIWLLNSTYSSAYLTGIELSNQGAFPPAGPTPTPSGSPTQTPTNTSTPSETPTMTPTTTETPTPTTSQTPTTTETPTMTPTTTTTPTNTSTPTMTPSGT